MFHISSSLRLAEAVVIEIVHANGKGNPTGGGSFALLYVFSENNSSYEDYTKPRASLFGEQPTGETPEKFCLSDIDRIDDGVKLDVLALLIIVLLALIGIMLS